MVFSQTSLKTQSILKVVEIDRLKQEKPQADGLNGVITDGTTATLQPACSFAEEYLKPEPVFESNMYHATDCEFFQDLAGWCSDPAKEEQVQIIDSTQQIEDRALNTDTLHTPFSPAGWDGFDANLAAAQASFYTTTPQDPLSPAEAVDVGLDAKFSFGLGLENDASLELPEQFVDIGSLPVVLGDADPWACGWDAHTKPFTDEHYTVPFIHQEDSLDMKYMTSVTPHEVENSRDVVVSEYIVAPPPRVERRAPALSLDVTHAHTHTHLPVISTPEVLSYVEQLEQEKTPLAAFRSRQAPAPETFISPLAAAAPAPLDYSPITPKSESHAESEEEAPRRRRRARGRSDDSDETYSPHRERERERERAPPRKYKRRKPNVPLKDMILALEGSQQLTRARRGRPPKRRDSVVSSACSGAASPGSTNTQDTKYRELRDKNNEASKRSRMHRKLKELQMEQEADELEEKNKKLRVQADILEEMTKRLKDALLTSILQK